MTIRQIKSAISKFNAGKLEKNTCGICMNCYHLRDGMDPTPLCDSCAHKALLRLNTYLRKKK